MLIGEAAETALVAATVGWTDLRDIFYFGGTSPRLSFALSDGNELVCLARRISSLATRSRVDLVHILCEGSVEVSLNVSHSDSHIGSPGLFGGERRGMCGYADY